MLNTHVLKLCLIKPPSVQGKAESCCCSKDSELAALVHVSSAACWDISGVEEHFPTLLLANYPLKAELESLGLVFFSLLICVQWMLLQLEERSCTSHLWIFYQVPASAGKRKSFTPSMPWFPHFQLIQATASYMQRLCSLKQRLSPTRNLLQILACAEATSAFLDSFSQTPWKQPGDTYEDDSS